MNDLGSSYTGPAKYLTQRDAPLEIPIEVIKNLFIAMDQDLDDHVSMKELKDYIKLHELLIDHATAEAMFMDASKVRRVTHDDQYKDPLVIEEIQMAVRGRYQFNNKTKEWGIYYKKYRNEWILMLLTVNERLFALQIPKVIPGKIRAQYEEQEEIAEMK